MDEKPVLLTKEGLEKLEAELAQLTTVRRSEVAERIRHARDFGDIAENAEYTEAIRRAAEGEKHEATRTTAEPFGGARLCAHADSDGTGAHWLPPGEKCRAEARQEQREA